MTEWQLGAMRKSNREKHQTRWAGKPPQGCERALRTLRERMGVRREELARAAGVSLRTIIRWERGDTKLIRVIWEGLVVILIELERNRALALRTPKPTKSQPEGT
jgi:hypothetical protein